MSTSGDSTSGLWSLSLVLRCLSRPPFEPIKLASDKHLTWKTSFLLALASAKIVSELHGFSLRVRHLRGRKSFTFLFRFDFMAKTQNPSVPDSHLEEFSGSLLDDFVGDDRDELLLCPIHALRKYRPGMEGLFVSAGRRKKRVFHSMIFFWLRSVISMARASASVEDCRSLRVRAHEVRKVTSSLLFRRNSVVHQLLKVETWSA